MVLHPLEQRSRNTVAESRSHSLALHKKMLKIATFTP